ncbi:MAG: hypothetical protein Q8J78_11955 [Moraxellaceae bacterium]|nr:hypothetical protein [Moraxellaceae bacterium]
MKMNSIKLFSMTILMSVSCAQAGMQGMSDEELSDHSGQAFIWSDRIAPNSLVGQMGAGSATDFSFFRMGLDAQLDFNLNIAKMQLGCGGINDNLVATPACDIDMDYVRFMGRTNSVAGAPATSNFVLRRPYIEIAFKNENNPSTREVVGIKIGAQSADGYVGVGRKYETGQTNIEHAGNCTAASVLSSPGQLNCHSGINSLSGFVGAELSASLPLTVIGSNGYGCAGNTALAADDCGPGDTLYIDYAGTRMNQLELADLALKLNGGLAGIIGSGYARLIANTRVLHGFALVNTSDFFISFQRQQVAYPRYTKTTPTAGDTPVCGTAANPDRCASAYAVPANPGWWINIPDAKLTNAVVD